jgi:Methane oxygenase PmoA
MSLLLGVAMNAAAASAWTCDDASGALGRTIAPVAVTVKLSKHETAAARKGLLGLAESAAQKPGNIIPVQWQRGRPGTESGGVLLLPAGPAAQRQFVWRESKRPFSPVLQATQDAATGQIEITDDGKSVLRYNYKSVEPGAVLETVTPANRIYARARSDYIHPLYGLNGEMLTRDWSVDHPHHRGIYWAWPEVDFGKERGDLHALQTVFARPTGKIDLQSGPVFAQIEAENQWLWNDREPIVRELALIRAYRATPQGRVVDLAFQSIALKDGVTIARRGLEHYGGLNVRLQTPEAQAISVFTGPSNAVPWRAWSDLSGRFPGSAAASGLMVLQQAQNPDYPGDWVQYPELSWCQPTFPASGQRFALRRGQPLLLRFRLWIHAGSTPEEEFATQLWDALHAPAAALPMFELLEVTPAK